MERFQKRLLLFAFVVPALDPLLDAQVRELGTGAPGPVKARHLTAELIADPTTIAPGDSGHVALSLTLDPGWHVYWVYAGDAGEPPAVVWSLPQGVAVGPMQYPAPSRLPVDPLMDYGYEGTAVFPFDLSASQHLALGGARLRAHVRWLVCREVCLPGRAYLGFDLKVAPRASAETNKVIDAAIHAEPLKAPDSVKIDAQVSRSLFAVFTALAIGLALPYLALAFVPGWARWLPRPGRWMETLKQLTSMPLFLTVVWLIWVYGHLRRGAQGDSSNHIALLLVGLVVLAIAGWILGRWPARRWGYIAAGITVIAALAAPLSASHSDRLQWQPFSDAALKAAQDQGKPVFVDFTAAWCLSCQVNEKAVLENKSVEQELFRRHYVLLRADWTRYDPEITVALNRVGRSGVPTYVVFSGTRAGSPHVLPEFLTRNVVLDAIRQTGS